MTATVTEPEAEPKPGKRSAGCSCGWCAPAFGQPPGCRDRDHRCKGTYRNGSACKDRFCSCSCAEAGHPGRPRPS